MLRRQASNIKDPALREAKVDEVFAQITKIKEMPIRSDIPIEKMNGYSSYSKAKSDEIRNAIENAKKIEKVNKEIDEVNKLEAPSAVDTKKVSDILGYDTWDDYLDALKNDLVVLKEKKVGGGIGDDMVRNYRVNALEREIATEEVTLATRIDKTMSKNRCLPRSV